MHLILLRNALKSHFSTSFGWLVYNDNPYITDKQNNISELFCPSRADFLVFFLIFPDLGAAISKIVFSVGLSLFIIFIKFLLSIICAFSGNFPALNPEENHKKIFGMWSEISDHLQKKNENWHTMDNYFALKIVFLIRIKFWVIYMHYGPHIVSSQNALFCIKYSFFVTKSL